MGPTLCHNSQEAPELSISVSSPQPSESHAKAALLGSSALEKTQRPRGCSSSFLRSHACWLLPGQVLETLSMGYGL